MPGIRNPIDGVTYRAPALAERYLREGAWIDLTVGDALRATAVRHPERIALRDADRAITFAEFDAASERLGAALLRAGLRPGDRAIFQAGTTIDTAIALLACFKAGVIPVCSLPQHRELEIGQLVRQSQARGYFVQADFGNFDLVTFADRMFDAHASLAVRIVLRGSAKAGDESLEHRIASVALDDAKRALAGVPIGSEDVLSFQLSGGTTGVPKIIPRFHAEYLGHAVGWMRQFRIDGASRLIWSLPLLHNAGQLYVLIPNVLHGVSVTLMARVDIPRMLDLIARDRITHALSIGPIAPQLLTYAEVARHDLSSLRLFATMSRADSLEAHIGLPCSNLYGITEGLLLGSGADAPEHARHRTQGASGVAQDEIRLLAPDGEREVPPGTMGELCFRGPSSLTGYVGAPEANANAFTSEGFYRTGDMMTAHVVDGVRYYAFEGRLRDNINRGGEKIGCEEVESLVSRHASVADAKLVPMPDPLYGEKGCVFVVLRPGAPAPSVAELGAFLGTLGCAKYKWPERIEIVDEFPTTRVGKVDKPALRRLIAARLSHEAAAAPRAAERA